jgi:hypothetical protein
VAAPICVEAVCVQWMHVYYTEAFASLFSNQDLPQRYASKPERWSGTAQSAAYQRKDDEHHHPNIDSYD